MFLINLVSAIAVKLLKILLCIYNNNKQIFARDIYKFND